MKRIILAVCLIMAATIVQAEENYHFNTNVEGMVNINGYVPGVNGHVNVGVNVNGQNQASSEYTFEVTARPIRPGRSYLKKIDQIHYALGGLSTNTAMLTSETLPWNKTISGSGIMTGSLVVAYANSLNKVINPKRYKRLENTEIVLAFYQAEKLLKKVKFRPSIDQPTAELNYSFENIQPGGHLSVGATVGIGQVEIDDNEMMAPAMDDPEEYSSVYTFEVLAKPLDARRPCLDLVERVNYRLNFRGGVVMDHLNQVELPWRKTFNRLEANEAYLSTDFVNSLDPFFNKKQARLAKNTVLILNIYNGPDLMKTVEYQPTKDENDAELEIEINQQ